MLSHPRVFILLAVLRRWCRCCSYSCSFVVNSTIRLRFSLALHFVLVFFSPFSIAITLLGEERAGPCALRAFVCFARDGLCLFPLPVGVRYCLRLVLVALPRRFSLPFCINVVPDLFSSIIINECGFYIYVHVLYKNKSIYYRYIYIRVVT